MKKTRLGTDAVRMARAKLSMVFTDVRGRMGQQVVSRTGAGLVAKRLPKYKYPKIAAVQAGSERLRQATLIWNEFTFDQAEAWREFGATRFRTDAVTGTRHPMEGKNAFMGLATKFLQVNPEGVVPMRPPEDGFGGDSVTISVSLLPSQARRAGDEGWLSPDPCSENKGSQNPTLTPGHGHPRPSPLERARVGGVNFTASGPNTAGVVTELLFQKLANVRRSPVKFYKSLTFHAFESGSLTLDVPLDPGVYAFAYRFVRESTGQQTDWLLMPGIVEVA